MVEPQYVADARELDDIFADMASCFEGRESEANWMARDKNVLRLRRLAKGNAPQDYHASFVAGIKALLDGILKVCNSLRTTMSTNGCQLVQDLAHTTSAALDPFLEILLQNFIKMCSATKHIAAQNGNTTVEVLLSHLSYNVRILHHILLATQDKNQQPRSFASSWLQIILGQHAQHKAQIEHAGGLELIEKCIKKGLGDANPKVREGMREAHWAFAKIWPDKAEEIMASLDQKSRQLLELANPSAPPPSTTSSEAPTKPQPARPVSSLKMHIVAQKKAAMAARQATERPSSAMAAIAPTTSSSSSQKPSTHSSSQSKTQEDLTELRVSTSSNSQRPKPAAEKSESTSSQTYLMQAPLRRPKKAEIARPMTADPYAGANRKVQRTPLKSLNENERTPLKVVNENAKQNVEVERAVKQLESAEPEARRAAVESCVELLARYKVSELPGVGEGQAKLIRYYADKRSTQQAELEMF